MVYKITAANEDFSPLGAFIDDIRELIKSHSDLLKEWLTFMYIFLSQLGPPFHIISVILVDLTS